MNLMGIYPGIVENVADPEKLGRVKARVPHVYGAAIASGSIGTDDLPWAMPAGMPAGGSPGSGGFSHLPDVGDKVWVCFLDGEPEKPVWLWGMQSYGDAALLHLHVYDESNGKVGKPKATRWTRYGHTIEINEGSTAIVTKYGYYLLALDSAELTGYLEMATPRGNFLLLDDEADGFTLMVNQDANFQIGDELIAEARSMDFFTTEGAITIDSSSTLKSTSASTTSLTSQEDMTLEATEDLSLSTDSYLRFTSSLETSFSYTRLLFGSATEPFCLGNQMVTFCTSLLSWLAAHTHSNGNDGAPTGPPIEPPTGYITPDPSALISTTIFGA